MKKYSLLLCIVLFCNGAMSDSDGINVLYEELDRCIENKNMYVSVRESRIQSLKDRITYSGKISFDESYAINLTLYNEYKSYRYDSAVYYLTRNIDLATANKRQKQLDESKILLSFLLSSAGMYKEASELLDGIKPKVQSRDLLSIYYLAYDHLYGELGAYTQYIAVKSNYMKKSAMYKDSAFAMMPTNIESYYNIRENIARDKQDYVAALKINDLRMKIVRPDTPEYSIVAFFRALDYRGLSDNENEKRWLAKSAISDIKSAVTDHASLWMLAEILYRAGDIERAHRYINFSWEETQSYHSRLRNLQSSEILSAIGNNYQSQIRKSNIKLRNYLLIISALVILLSIAVVYVYVQMTVISKAKNHLRLINSQLQELNDELYATNNALNQSNQQLYETNRIKEEYIGRFFGTCSIYIDKLDSFRKMVTRKINTNQTIDLLNVTKSLEFQEKEIAELYKTFDSTFLNLFPNFVSEFNKLLQDEEQIKPINNETLTPELRIFALIRLGIDDSSKIAEFLHYSPNTIYNYRARVKNKAKVARDLFENMVKRIS